MCRILHEYRVHNAEVLFRGDYTSDEFIDVVLGNRKYVKCLYVYNKIDQLAIEDVDKLARMPMSLVISVRMNLNLDFLLARMWDAMGLVRVYTKRRGEAPAFSEPVVLSEGRHGCTVEAVCRQIHKSMLDDFHYAYVWGCSTKHNPQRCGLRHELGDEDVVQVVKTTVSQQKKDKNYGRRCQAAFDKYKEKKKKKPLKT